MCNPLGGCKYTTFFQLKTRKLKKTLLFLFFNKKNMNLVIDAGNTFVKVAFIDNNEIVCVKNIDYEYFTRDVLGLKHEIGDVENIMVSSVSHFKPSTIKNIFPDKKIRFLDHKTQLPFKNMYKTPSTLGVDRIALVASAVKRFPNKNALVIDAGTCITYDFVNSKKEYFGGSIAPGLQMRYKSLAHYTAKLPLLSPKLPKELIGNSTENAIHSGVCTGLIAEIEGIIKKFSNNYEGLVVILTGGDANFLSKRLKSGIFVDQNFLLYGLGYILEHIID